MYSRSRTINKIQNQRRTQVDKKYPATVSHIMFDYQCSWCFCFLCFLLSQYNKLRLTRIFRSSAVFADNLTTLNLLLRHICWFFFFDWFFCGFIFDKTHDMSALSNLRSPLLLGWFCFQFCSFLQKCSVKAQFKKLNPYVKAFIRHFITIF